MSRFIVLFVLGFAFAQTAIGSVIHIANGDCAGLASAVASAPADEETTIILARGGSYLSYGGAYASCSIIVNTGNILVEGSGSEIQPFCLSQVLTVSAGASLTLRNALLTPPECGYVPPQPREVSNSGELQLEAVNISGFSVYNDANAAMTLRNATSWGGGITNFGNLNVFNSTLLLEGVLDNGNGRIVLANSVTSTFSSDACAVGGPRVQSMGGNVIVGNCDWAVPADRRSTDSNAGFGPLQNNGGLGVPTFAPTSSSIVRGAGVWTNCEPTDARGLVRSSGVCDAGAVQFDETKYLGGGGMNGTWYDHAANGHYVTIQRVHDDDTALVIWNTFDTRGNQAWIYGVGHVSDRHIHVEMSQNLGGHLQLGGAPMGSSVHPWGTVDIDLTSCISGTLHYQSAVTGFGSGQFPLDRLAYVSDFGCVD